MDTYIADGGTVCNMRTEGILRLLDGESFAMHDDDRATLMATDEWRRFVGEHASFPRWSKETFHRFWPITVNADDVFLWSPFADSLCSFTSARCTDGTLYPYLIWPLLNIFPHCPRVPFTTVQSNWLALSRRLAHVRYKGVVLYPPDHLIMYMGDSAHTRSLQIHIQSYNSRAAALLEQHGWTVFIPDAEICPTEPFWSHYSERSKQALWSAIEQEFFGVHAYANGYSHHL